MPVRFQVDGDFYDHPKVIGMSDAAFKLWVRAGSFCANKLTDGFVSEDVLAETLRAERAVAEELVNRRLWRRVKGGYRFHEWGDRNLLKARVQADREADRIRKANGRKTQGQNANPQAGSGNVHPESERNPDGIPPDSKRIPGDSVSVSVSVSESVSGSGREAVPGHPPGSEPPTRCLKHSTTRKPPPCGDCADARRLNEAWQLQRAEYERTAPKCAKHRGKLAHNCPLCRADHLADLAEQARLDTP
jgi:hypothetical protein